MMLNRNKRASRYSEALKDLGRVVPNPERVGRAHLRSEAVIEFCIEPGTWYRWEAGSLSRRHALDDQELPLASWAAKQSQRKISILAYRPGRRLVLADSNRDCLLKGYRVSRFAGCVRQQQLGATQAKAAGLCAPALLEADTGYSAYAMSRCPGQPLSFDAVSVSTMTSLGAGIAAFAGRSASLPPATRSALASHTQQNEDDLLLELGQRTEAMLGGLPSGWWETRHQLQKRTPTLSTGALCHRDLHDGQLLVNAGALALLDFDLLCVAAPEVDAGNLIAHIYLRAFQQGQWEPSQANRLASQFLAGYRKIGSLNSDALVACCASALLRLALVYAVRPRWQPLAEPLTRAASDVLGRRMLTDLERT